MPLVKEDHLIHSASFVKQITACNILTNEK